MNAFFKLIDGRLQRLERIPHVSNAGQQALAAYAQQHGFLPYVSSPKPSDGARYHHEFRQDADAIRDVWSPAPKTAQERVAELKQALADSDYVAAKLAEVDGEQRAALLAEYAEVLAQRQAWRSEIGELEQEV